MNFDICKRGRNSIRIMRVSGDVVKDGCFLKSLSDRKEKISAKEEKKTSVISEFGILKLCLIDIYPSKVFQLIFIGGKAKNSR